MSMDASASRIPWWEPKLGDPVKNAVIDVIDSAYINDGPVTRALEKRVAELAGVRFCVATPSCTSALTICLIAAGVGPGDEVIVPDVTFIATANAVKLAGGEVKLVDVDPGNLTISPDRVAEAIGPATRAVLTVDFNGRGADYRRLEEICTSHNISLICDSAEALGSVLNGRPLGSYGQAGCFSFSGNKMFFGGQGGAAVTDDEVFYQRLRDLRDHGKRDFGPMADTLHANVGFNFKYPNVNAAIILAQLAEFDARMAHAKIRDVWYQELLSDCNEVTFPAARLADGEVGLWADAYVEDKRAMMDRLDAAGIEFRQFFMPLHRQAPYLQDDDAFPNAIRAWERGLWLPSALSLTRAQAERVASICRHY